MRAFLAYAALIAASFAFISYPVFGSAISRPQGFYVMQALHQENVKDQVLSSPNLAGIHLRDRWLQVETAPGNYSFAWLDQQILRAKSLGKQISLGIYAGVNSPSWLNASLVNGVPMPWDPDVLNAHNNMVAALGARYRNETAIAAVHVSSPATNESLEMFLPDGLTAMPGYSDDAIIETWKSALNTYAAAFPNATLVLDVAMAPDSRGAITDAVAAYARQSLGDRITFIHCSLKATTNPEAPHHETVFDLRRAGARIGFEMVSPSIDADRFGGSLAEALSIGQSAGASWYQIYQADVPAIPPNFFSVSGDYNHNGVVDAGDYTVWRTTVQSTNLTADGDENGRVDQGDYAIWRANFGKLNGSATAASVAVPESSSTILLMIVLTSFRLPLSRRRNVSSSLAGPDRA
jgi:hypothetical protein